MRRWLASVLGAAWLLVGFATGAAGEAFEIATAEAGFPIPRTVRYDFQVRNEGDRASDAELWVYAPVRRSPTQICLRIETSHPADLTEEPFGNQVLHFALPHIPPRGARLVSVRAELGLSDEAQGVPGDDPGDFLGPTPTAPCDHPAILEPARDLPGTGPADVTRSAVAWVAERVAYSGYRTQDRGALQALREGRGDCSEFSFLLVALLRARQIPARPVAGYRCVADCVPTPADFHQWVEYFDGGRWRLADALDGTWDAQASRFVALKTSIDVRESGQSFHRFRSSGEGIRVTMR